MKAKPSKRAPERPEERSERSERSDEGLSGARAVTPEVCEKAIRRKYSAEYKLKILEEADNCHERGQVGFLLRREGLYFSALTNWRKWRSRMSDTKPHSKINKALHNENAKLKRENDRLKLKLKRAEGLIELQKKISEMMEIDPDDQRS